MSQSIISQDITILFLNLLSRVPSFDEISYYRTQLISNVLTIEQVEVEIKSTNEYKILQGDFYGDVSFDQYTIELTNINKNNYDGVLLGNGKICVKTGALPYESEYSAITTKYNFNSLGRYNNNISKGFKFTNVKFFNKDYTNIEISEHKQQLNMRTGTFTNSYKIKDTVTSKEISVEQDMLALQQYPYCFLHNIKLINESSSSIEIDIFHIISHDSNISNFEFFNNNPQGSSMFMTTGKEEDKQVEIVNNNLYKSKDSLTNMGSSKVDSKTVSYKMKTTILPNSSSTIQIISGMMSTNDFVDPKVELTRILLNIQNFDLQNVHNNAWLDIWNTADISITQKEDIMIDQVDEATNNIATFKKNIKYSLYNIFSIVRDDVNVDINSLNLSAIDVDGEVFWNAEMFLIPVLLLLRPKCAKVLLDFRFSQLANARNLALAYGNKGSQYPYKNDVMYYQSISWNATSPIYAFNTGLIGISTWNYYRVTLDKYWLYEKGYPILQNCARFFYSIFDENNNLKEVFTLNNVTKENDSLTKYFAIDVIKYYREASLVLNFHIQEDINELYKNVKNEPVEMFNNVSSINSNVSSGITPNQISISYESFNTLTFYDTSTNANIGTNLGELSGSSLEVLPTANYEFLIDTNTFVKLYNASNVEIVDFEGTALYSSDYGLTAGSVLIENGNISSYKHTFNNDTIIGTNAFYSGLTPGSPNTTFNHIINNGDISLSNNVIETAEYKDNILETHIIMMNYYSRSFFNNTLAINKSDIIRDNVLYYSKKNTNDVLLNRLISGNLECLLAQDVGLPDLKEYYINTYEKNTLDKVFLSSEVSKPWGNHNYHALFIFNILTSMVKMRIKGGINDHKFYTDNFGIDFRSGFVLPKYWKSMAITYNKKSLVVVNSN
jgi:hypothetical protein